MDSECLAGKHHFFSDKWAERLGMDVKIGLDNDHVHRGDVDHLPMVVHPVMGGDVADSMDSEGVAAPKIDEGVADPMDHENAAD